MTAVDFNINREQYSFHPTMKHFRVWWELACSEVPYILLYFTQNLFLPLSIQLLPNGQISILFVQTIQRTEIKPSFFWGEFIVVYCCGAYCAIYVEWIISMEIQTMNWFVWWFECPMKWLNQMEIIIEFFDISENNVWSLMWIYLNRIPVYHNEFFQLIKLFGVFFFGHFMFSMKNGSHTHVDQTKNTWMLNHTRVKWNTHTSEEEKTSIV